MDSPRRQRRAARSRRRSTIPRGTKQTPRETYRPPVGRPVRSVATVGGGTGEEAADHAGQSVDGDGAGAPGRAPAARPSRLPPAGVARTSTAASITATRPGAATEETAAGERRSASPATTARVGHHRRPTARPERWPASDSPDGPRPHRAGRRDACSRLRAAGSALGLSYRRRVREPSRVQKLPRLSCSRSMASNSALKLPIPNPSEPCRSMNSKNRVGRSPSGLVKICSR